MKWIGVGMLLALAGCTVVDDWNSFRIEHDAGPEVDSGTDSDADVGRCADTSVCDACPTTCMVTPGASVATCSCPGSIEGSICSVHEDCREGLGCLDGTCRRRCTDTGRDAECIGALAPHCTSFDDGGFCVADRCNPFHAGDDCDDDGDTCALDASGALACVATGALGASRLCNGAGECAPGFACLLVGPSFPDPGTSRCVPFCDAGSPGSCDAAVSTGCAGAFPTGAVVLTDGTILGACVPRDADDDAWPLPLDCDDTKGTINPGRAEVCDANHVDEDCNPLTPTAADADNDGFNSRCCNGVGCGQDCNDGVGSIHPGAAETCDGVDSACNGGLEGQLGEYCQSEQDCCSGGCNTSTEECE